MKGEINLKPPEEIADFISDLNAVQISTRYPEEMKQLMKNYKKEKTHTTLRRGQETLTWLKRMY